MMNIQKVSKNDQALCCIPLVSQSQTELLTELQTILPKQPDLVEWRADYFHSLSNTAEVLLTAKKLKEAAPDTTFIFTIRSLAEGGQATSLSADQSVELTATVCEQTQLEYVDCELSQKSEAKALLARRAAAVGKKVIGSYHNFSHTPPQSELIAKFKESESADFSVAKVAVMPQSMEDVLTLMSAALAARKILSIPLIALSMGDYGVITRMMAADIGSSVTFVVGQKASAPGQIPIDDFRILQSLVKKKEDLAPS
ncbi:MAG: type I 3-dehydroquinate dehydratase [Sporomusaceae bacterium]|nr:type I 3-dehydroquinate dehydratase [Sporomusaceae bacterium]